MVIPWIVGGAVVFLALWWRMQAAKRRLEDRAFGAAVRNRQDVKRYLGDNE